LTAKSRDQKIILAFSLRNSFDTVRENTQLITRSNQEPAAAPVLSIPDMCACRDGGLSTLSERSKHSTSYVLFEVTMSQPPSTALIILGEAMFLQPDGEGVLSVTVTAKEELSTCLQLAEGNGVEHSSLDDVHVVVKSNDVPRLYDPDAPQSFYSLLRPGGAVNFHVLSGEEIGGTSHASPAPEEVGETIKMSLVLAELRVESEAQGPNGTKILVGRKADTAENS